MRLLTLISRSHPTAWLYIQVRLNRYELQSLLFAYRPHHRYARTVEGIATWLMEARYILRQHRPSFNVSLPRAFGLARYRECQS